ncbi:MAG: hypothetical protein NPIRA04_17720 [Nitrospirales bacterium]|nr:MAG: hypothetical protein NPIRA04_17720 [Nitrospirales bacterium]
MGMTVRQQIILDRVDQVVSQLNLEKDLAFLRFSHQIITGQSIFSFDQADLTEGGQDKQVDSITIDEEPDQATIYILQAKNTDTFSSNSLIHLRNGLDWLFTKARSDVMTIQNVLFKDKILEYRSLQNSMGPSNIRVFVRFVTWGNTSDISEEFNQELKTIRDQLDNGTFAEFSCEPVGADEIVQLLTVQEKRERRIDADIKIRYDTNNPSLIRYYSDELTGLVCSVPASEIARLVNQDKDGAIFDLNIRRFLGSRGGVNKDIHDAAVQTDQSRLFWFLNNGITIVCDKFDAVTDPDNPHVKVKNMQIVNGCQTATTLAMAQTEGTLARDVRVIARIYATKDSELVNKIVRTTNNQNRISSRDLRANDQVQIDLENGFLIHNFFYERKPRQYADSDASPDRIFPNENVARAYLALVLRKPSDSRGRKYKVWGETYDKIFGGFVVEPYIITSLIVKRGTEHLNNAGFTRATDDLERNIAKKGVYHVSRIAAFFWRGNDQWNIGQNILREQLKTIMDTPGVLVTHLDAALTRLIEIIRNDSQHVSDVDAALKSYTLDEQIDRNLYQK